MRLNLVFLIVFSQVISQEKPIKTFFSKENNFLYSFYEKNITVMNLHGGALQDIKLHPIPEGYQDYNPIWYKNQLHLLSQRGGLLYRVENDSFVLTNHFNTISNFSLMILYTGTPCFAMEVMAFGRRTTFLPILIALQKNGSITQPVVLQCQTSHMTVQLFFLMILFMFWADKQLISQQVFREKKATKSGHSIFSHENGQIAEKWVLTSTHISQFKKTAFFF